MAYSLDYFTTAASTTVINTFDTQDSQPGLAIDLSLSNTAQLLQADARCLKAGGCIVPGCRSLGAGEELILVKSTMISGHMRSKAQRTRIKNVKSADHKRGIPGNKSKPSRKRCNATGNRLACPEIGHRISLYSFLIRLVLGVLAQQVKIQ